MGQDLSASVGGTMISSGGQRVGVFASGRVCHEPGCGTQLSVYNSGAYCPGSTGRRNDAVLS